MKDGRRFTDTIVSWLSDKAAVSEDSQTRRLLGAIAVVIFVAMLAFVAIEALVWIPKWQVDELIA